MLTRFFLKVFLFVAKLFLPGWVDIIIGWSESLKAKKAAKAESVAREMEADKAAESAKSQICLTCHGSIESGCEDCNGSGLR